MRLRVAGAVLFLLTVFLLGLASRPYSGGFTEGVLASTENPDLLLRPSLKDLSESIEVSGEGKVYTVKLKNPVASEVILALRTWTEYDQIAGEVLNERAVRLSLEQPFAPFASLIESLPITVGEALKKARFKRYDYQHDLETAAKLGEVDGFVGELNWSGWRVIKTPLKNRSYTLFFNLDRPALQDVKLRRDLARAVDKEAIIKTALDGNGVKAIGPLDFSPVPYDELATYDFDPHLEKNYQIKLTLVVPDREEHLKTAKIIQSGWANLGVEVEVRTFDPTELTENILRTRDFDVLLFGQSVGKDPDRYALWHSTQVEFPGLNFSGYKNMRVDKALEEARKTLNWDERVGHYQNMQAIIMEDSPAIFLYHPMFIYSIKEKFGSVDLSPLFSAEERFRFISAALSPHGNRSQL